VDLPLALLPKTEKLTMLQMDSKLRLDDFEKVLALAVEGCKKIHEILLEYVRSYTQELVTSRGVFHN
jgi:exosome complex component RRP41